MLIKIETREFYFLLYKDTEHYTEELDQLFVSGYFLQDFLH